MALTSPSHERTADSGTETLAELLARGQLSLAAALRCGTEVARLLNDLHQQDRTHGKVAATHVVLRPSGAELLPSRSYWDRVDPERDVQAFGALVYELMTGRKVPADADVALFRIPASPSGAAGIRAAAIRLAGKCLGHLQVKLTMQQAATEIRLLWVVARQLESSGAHESQKAPYLVHAPAPPPVVRPMQVVMTRPPSVKPSAAAAHSGPPAVPAEAGESPVVPVEAANFSKSPATPAALEPAGGHCPKCDSAAVYVSRARSKFELLLTRWKFPICRCHRCYHRWVAVARMRIAKEMPVGAARRFRPKRRK